VAAAPSFSVDDLPRFSPWPGRLLGLDPWTGPERTREEILREFGRDKWGRLLERARVAAGPVTVEQLDEWFHVGSPSLVLDRGQLVLMDPATAQRRFVALLRDVIAAHSSGATALVELGAGYGSTLLGVAQHPALRACPLIAGELTASGRILTALAAEAGGVAVDAVECDLASETILPRPPPPGAIVVTSFALTYLDRVPPAFFEQVASWHPLIVVHVEPCREEYDPQTMLGLLQRRYADVNSYCPTIAGDLRAAAGRGVVEVIAEQPNWFGGNPLLPGSLILWRPATDTSGGV
jgi:hypothetical protein